MTNSTTRVGISRRTTFALLAATTVSVLLSGCGSATTPAPEHATHPTTSARTQPLPDTGVAGHVTIDGSSVNVLCTGLASTKPTIVLLAGFPDPLTKFASLQATLSRTTRVCSYDRLGEGKSAQPPRIQTLSDSAAVLAGLLDTEKITGKVVVVGHSLGGLIAAQFAHQYPARIAGLVLLDATAPSVIEGVQALIPASATGVPGEVRAEVGNLSSAATNTEKLVYTGRPLGSLGTIPLTVVQHGQPIYSVVPRYAKQLQRIWTEGQHQLAHLSTNSKLVTATHSGHYIYLDQPALAVQLIEHATTA